MKHVAWIIAAAGTMGPTTTGFRFSVSSITYPWTARRNPLINQIPRRPARDHSRGSGSGIDSESNSAPPLTIPPQNCMLFDQVGAEPNVLYHRK